MIREVVKDLIKNLRTDSPDWAAHGISRLANQSHIRAVISQEGGIQPLIQILHEGSQKAQATAAEALQNLALDNQSQALIGMQEGITPLIKILYEGSEEGQVNAASALRNLALNSKNRDAIQKEGGRLLKGILKDAEAATPQKSPELDKVGTILRNCIKKLRNLCAAPHLLLARCYEMQSKHVLAVEECGHAISIIPANEMSNLQSVSGQILADAKLSRAEILDAALGNTATSLAEYQEIWHYTPSES